MIRVLRLVRWRLLVAATLAIGATVLVGARVHRGDAPDRLRLVSGAAGGFSISGSVSGLAPGNASSVLRLTATNPMSVPITVGSVSAQLTSAAYANGSAAPAVCATYLDPAFPATGSSHTWSGLGLTVAADNGQASLSEPLVFTDRPTVNQDACRGVMFTLAYTAVATYLETYATSTVLTASASPAVAGQPVSYTATVTAASVAGQDQPASGPTGTVSFTDDGAVIGGCANVPLITGSGLGSIATCTSIFPSPAAHSIVASYTNTDGNFAASVSPALIAAGACVSTPTSTASTIVTSTVNGNVEVRSGKSYWLHGGTITGNLTVDAGGQFAGTGGSVKGNVLANGTTALSGTTVGGNVTATNAGFADTSASIAGNLTSQGSGPLCVTGISVNGNLTAQTLRSTITSSVCGSTVRGNLVVQSSAVTLLIGSGTTCVGNTASGNLSVQADTGPVTIQSNTVGGNLLAQTDTAMVTIGGSGLGNRVAGNLTVQANKGGGTTVGNTVTGGSCLLQSDNPQFTGSANTVRPGALNTCNGKG